MSELKELLINGAQGCINTYEGKHGKVEKLYDEVKKITVHKYIQFYFGYKNGKLHIDGRGSDEWKDWGQNLNTDSIDIDVGQIHTGFFEDHLRIFDICAKECEKFNEIQIIGHSKFGSQTELLYYFLKKMFVKKIITGIAYAPAKCMSKEFKPYMRDLITVINGEDYITKLPQWKFSHMGKIIRVGNRNPLMWIPFIRMFGSLDHYPQRYLENIKKAKI